MKSFEQVYKEWADNFNKQLMDGLMERFNIPEVMEMVQGGYLDSLGNFHKDKEDDNT